MRITPQMLRNLPAALFCAGASLLLAGCGSEQEATAAPAAPLVGIEDVYAAAASPALPHVTPEDRDDLENVYRLSKNIISGGEPFTEAALERIAEMGVKTILCVDGKVPDVETARRLGMRYVHIPVRYDGFSRDEVKKIVKTFQELEGPFFVHCFHGVHRGPAAAALGRVAIDGVSRERAMAEMRQYCGTAPKYEGLYRTIAEAPIPTTAELSRYAFTFPERHQAKGIRHAMVKMTRVYDDLKALTKRNWEVDPNHPDIDPVNSATILRDLYVQSNALADTKKRDDQYRAWMLEGEQLSNDLITLLEALKAGDEDAAAKASAKFTAIKNNCVVCHTDHRNN